MSRKGRDRFDFTIRDYLRSYQAPPSSRELIKGLRHSFKDAFAGSGIKKPNRVAKELAAQIGQMFMINAAAAAPRTGKGHTFG